MEKRQPKELYISMFALTQRLKRHLSNLCPARYLQYNKKDNAYYVAVLHPDQHNHYDITGPYYAGQLIGLGRFIGMFSILELRAKLSILTAARKQIAEQPLPPELRFPVISKTTQAAIDVLKENPDAVKYLYQMMFKDQRDGVNAPWASQERTSAVVRPGPRYEFTEADIPEGTIIINGPVTAKVTAEVRPGPDLSNEDEPHEMLGPPPGSGLTPAPDDDDRLTPEEAAAMGLY